MLNTMSPAGSPHDHPTFEENLAPYSRTPHPLLGGWGGFVRPLLLPGVLAGALVAVVNERALGRGLVVESALQLA